MEVSLSQGSLAPSEDLFGFGGRGVSQPPEPAGSRAVERAPVQRRASSRHFCRRRKKFEGSLDDVDQLLEATRELPRGKARQRERNRLHSVRSRELREARRREDAEAILRLRQGTVRLRTQLRALLDRYTELAASCTTCVGNLKVAAVDPQLVLGTEVEDCVARLEDLLGEGDEGLLADGAEALLSETGRLLDEVGLPDEEDSVDEPEDGGGPP
jgi:hypothetical protein